MKISRCSRSIKKVIAYFVFLKFRSGINYAKESDKLRKIHFQVPINLTSLLSTCDKEIFDVLLEFSRAIKLDIICSCSLIKSI